MDVPLLLEIFPQVLLDGIILGFMYALIALGYTMVYGVLEFINFVHSEIFIVGAFVGVEILLGLKAAGLLETVLWPLVLLGVLLAGALASGALAVTIERLKAKLAAPPTDLNAVLAKLTEQLGITGLRMVLVPSTSVKHVGPQLTDVPEVKGFELLHAPRPDSPGPGRGEGVPESPAPAAPLRTLPSQPGPRWTFSFSSRSFRRSSWTASSSGSCTP